MGDNQIKHVGGELTPEMKAYIEGSEDFRRGYSIGVTAIKAESYELAYAAGIRYAARENKKLNTRAYIRAALIGMCAGGLTSAIILLIARM